jgi:hypothetical protein
MLYIFGLFSDNATRKAKGESSGISGKGQSSVYQNETPEPCYFSSSIYYGGQENYSPRTKNAESQHVVSSESFNKLIIIWKIRLFQPIRIMHHKMHYNSGT